MKRTSYYYYVRPVCEDGDGPRFPTSKTFRTECGTVPLPYIETFDSYSPSDRLIPECWLRKTTYSSVYPYITTTTSYAGEGKGMLNFYSGYNSYSYAVLPEFEIDSVKRLTLTFDGFSTYTNSDLKIGIMTDPEDYRVRWTFM